MVGLGCIKPQTGTTEPNYQTTGHHQETSENVSWIGGLLPAVHPKLRHPSSTPARSDLEDPAKPGAVDPGVEAAFQDLQGALCQEPVVANPNFQLHFMVQAEGGGIGAVLSQVQDGAEHPIACISHCLLKHKHNYATAEKERLPIKWTISKFCCLTVGRVCLEEDSNAGVTR